MSYTVMPRPYVVVSRDRGQQQERYQVDKFTPIFQTKGHFGNVAGCLFYAGVFCYGSGALSTAAQREYAAVQADGRVNVNWGYNVSRGIMCNWLVGIAFIFATEGRDLLSKIVGIRITITTFVAMGSQHSIANYFMVPIGMFYGGTHFSVGKFIWASCIQVTIGNVIGGAFFGAFSMWMVYGRHEQSVLEIQKHEKTANRNRV